MAPKSIALLVVGVIIISTLFSVFQVTYPTGNPVLSPIQPKQYQLFKYQFTDKNLLGNSSTSFVPTGNGTITIEGYVHSSNGSSNTPISDAYLYAAVFPAESDYYTNSNGFYQITVIKYGHGTFAFQVPGFNPKLFKLDLYGSSVYWLNISLNPAQKYNISGTTVDQGGHLVPNAKLTFSDFVQTFTVESSKAGGYSLSLYNGTYIISVTKPGFANQPKPYMLVVNGIGNSNFKLTLKSLSTPSYYVSGYVHNVKGALIKGASVTSSLINSTSQTNSSGYYVIEVPFGSNTIIAFANGYGYNYTQVYVRANLTDINLTLTNNNPFGNSGPNSINGTGTSGLPPGAVKNITGALGNKTSSVNYGNNSSGSNGNSGGSNGGSGSGIILQGNVTNSNNSAPVADTYLYFYVNVNGTYYYEGVMTNSTGYYSIVVAYKGHYNFYVYSPLYENYSFGIWINGTSQKDFNLTPLPGTTYKVSGEVVNNLDGVGIPAKVTVYASGSLSPMMQAGANGTGNYAIYLIKGNYSMKASSYGFSSSWNNSSMQPLSVNLMKDFSLNPVSTLGSSTSLWNQSGSTGMPGVSSSNVSSQLSNSSGGNSLATGVKAVTLTMHMVNATDNSSLVNMQYELFIKLNSVVYKYNGNTNQTGNSTILLGYDGNYSLLVETFYYYGKTVSINMTKNTSTVMYLHPRAVHILNVTLVNAYNLTGGINVTVPATYLNITNYKQSLYRTSTKEITGVGTVFDYSLPKGNYSFAYNNVNYVTHSFSANISNAPNSTIQHIKPYLVIVNSNSSAVFTYSLIPARQNAVAVSPNSSYQEFYAGQANLQYSFSAYLGNNLVAGKIFTLSAAKPVSNLYLNITGGSRNETQNYWSVYPVQNSSVKVTTSYDYQNTQNVYIYALAVNYTLGSGLVLEINGAVQNNITRNGTGVSFSTYYAYKGGVMNTSFQSSYGISSAPTRQELEFSAMTVYYYTPVFAYATSSGGN